MYSAQQPPPAQEEEGMSTFTKIILGLFILFVLYIVYVVVVLSSISNISVNISSDLQGGNAQVTAAPLPKWYYVTEMDNGVTNRSTVAERDIESLKALCLAKEDCFGFTRNGEIIHDFRADQWIHRWPGDSTNGIYINGRAVGDISNTLSQIKTSVGFEYV